VKDASIAPFFATLRAANPEPASELDYASVFELLAAVLLSAQATDRGVNKATRRLFAIAPTPQKMLALGLAALEDSIRTIGLYRTKAKNLLATCRILVEEHGGQVPRTRAALACPVCFGNSDSPLAIATNMGIIAMLVVVAGMIGAFATFFIYLNRRAKRVAAQEGTA